jgi:hypothetical protein
MNREPLITAAGIVALVTTGIALLVSFGLPVTPDQVKAILSFTTVVAPLAVAWIVRPKVTPLSDPRDSDGSKLVSSECLQD